MSNTNSQLMFRNIDIICNNISFNNTEKETKLQPNMSSRSDEITSLHSYAIRI